MVATGCNASVTQNGSAINITDSVTEANEITQEEFDRIYKRCEKIYYSVVIPTFVYLGDDSIPIPERIPFDLIPVTEYFVDNDFTSELEEMTGILEILESKTKIKNYDPMKDIDLLGSSRTHIRFLINRLYKLIQIGEKYRDEDEIELSSDEKSVIVSLLTSRSLYEMSAVEGLEDDE
jgi:hypothetical protein